jgi:hypothetical protein
MKSIDLVLGLSWDDSTGLVSTSDSSPQNRPGEKCTVLTPGGDRVFKYMKAQEAFAIGQVAMQAALLVDADVDQAQATTTNILKGTGDFTASEFGSSKDAAYPDAYVTIDAGTGAGQTRKIVHNRGSTDYLTVDRNWSTALDTTSDYVVYSPTYVSLLDTDDISEDAAFAMGVAISAISANEWGWFQVKGFCPLVRAVGTTDAIVKGEIIVPSATAGACKGPDATLDAADALSQFGLAVHAYAAADSAGNGIAAILDCKYS